jgi:stage V sporulation protein K
MVTETLNPIINDDLIRRIRYQGSLMSSLCLNLSQDNAIMHSFYDKYKEKMNYKRVKPEDVLMSDLITLYSQQQPTDKANFILGYFYDLLILNKSSKINVDEVNQNLPTDDDFKVNLKSICDTYKFTDKLILMSCDGYQNHALQIFKEFSKISFDVEFDVKPQTNKVENVNVDAIPEGDTLEKVMTELNQLIGLDKVKADVNELINLLKIQKLRDAEGLKNIEITLHNVFLGPPGTGKTTVARLLSRIYYHLGFLSKGQVYETDREGLVAGYVGQTATKVNTVVNESLGGVLFIDEAYSLTQNLMGNDYGAEAINTLLKRMEDHRDDLSVVVAGYTEPMKAFIESNHGLRSRFNRYFQFDHFTAAQLMQIFEGYCKNGDVILDKEAKKKLSDTLELLVEKRDDSFGNARVIRNLFEKCTQNQANRIIKLKKISKKTLKTFKEDDIPEPNDTVALVTLTKD